MNLFKGLLQLLPAKIVFSLRYIYDSNDRKGLSKALIARPSLEPRLLESQETVVVVGAGISAITLVQQLKRKGHQKIIVVSESNEPGGTCVHSGCMPLEFFWSQGGSSEGLQEYTQALSAAGLEILQASAQQLIFAKVDKVSGKNLILNNGNHLSFDRLVLATGKASSVESEGQVSLSQLYHLKGKRVLLINDSSLQIYSLAAMLVKNNCRVLLLNKKMEDWSELDSLKAWKESEFKDNLNEFNSVKNININKGQVSFSHKNGEANAEFDVQFRWSSGWVNLPLIDQKTVSFFDIDSTSSSIKTRPDIYVLGDASGRLSAAEAELHAVQLAEVMFGNQQNFGLDMNFPVRLHGQKSWAASGELWTYFEKALWQKMDFNQLGWSFTHQKQGALWYLFDAKSKKVLGIQIVHELASELISLAHALMKFPIHDEIWLKSTVHPSAGEIFKKVAEECLGRTATSSRTEHQTIYLNTLPILRENIPLLEKTHGRQIVKRALLARDPEEYLAKEMARKEFSKLWKQELTEDDLKQKAQFYFDNKNQRALIKVENQEIEVTFF